MRGSRGVSELSFWARGETSALAAPCAARSTRGRRHRIRCGRAERALVGRPPRPWCARVCARIPRLTRLGRPSILRSDQVNSSLCEPVDLLTKLISVGLITHDALQIAGHHALDNGCESPVLERPVVRDSRNITPRKFFVAAKEVFTGKEADLETMRDRRSSSAVTSKSGTGSF